MEQPRPSYRWRWVSSPTELQPNTPEWSVFKALIGAPGGFGDHLRARGFKKSTVNLWWREDEHQIVKVCLHALIQVDGFMRRSRTALEKGRGWHGFLFFERVDVWFKATRPHWTGIMGSDPALVDLPRRRGGPQMVDGDLRFGSIIAAEDLFRTDPAAVPVTIPFLPWWMQGLRRLRSLPPWMLRREARSLADLTPHFPRVRPSWFEQSLTSTAPTIWRLAWIAQEERYGRFADALAWRCCVDDASEVLMWGWETYGAPWLDRVERDGLAMLADRVWSLDPVGFYASGLLNSDWRAWRRYRTQRDPLACVVGEYTTEGPVNPRAIHLWMCSLFDLLGQTERRDRLLQAILQAPTVTAEMVFETVYQDEVNGRTRRGEAVLTPEESWDRNRSYVEGTLERQDEVLGWANRFAREINRRDGG